MGTMRERSPGTWELTVSTGWDPTKGRYGRVIRTVRTSSRREVKAALARLEVEVAGGHVGTADPTVAQLLDRWMEHLARLGRSDSTLYNYGKYIDRELLPAIGDVRLSKLTARHLDGLYTALTQTRSRAGDDPPDPRRRPRRAEPGRALGTGRPQRRAAGLGTVPTPARAASADRGAGARPHRRGHPNRPDVRAVRARRRRHRHAPLRGVRAAVVRRRPPSRAAHRGAQSRLSARRERRSTDQDALRSHDHARRRHHRRTSPGVARGRVSSPASPVSTTRLVAPATSSASMPTAPGRGGATRSRPDGSEPAGTLGAAGVRLHDLRHWQATQLLDAGVPVPTVAARLGHADGTTTMKIYAHRTERADEQAAQVVGAALGRLGRRSE